MAVRKEQVLVLVALALGVLIWRNSGNAGGPRLAQPATQKYAAKPVRSLLLAPAEAAAVVTRALGTEPSETQPLPPRELHFPDRAPLGVIALPLEIGPDLAHAERLRLPGTIVEGVTLQSTAASGAAPGNAGDAAPGDAPGAGQTIQQKLQRWSHVYDRVWLENQNLPLIGLVEAPGVDRFDLEANPNPSEVVVHLRRFQLDKEVLSPETSIFDSRSNPKVAKVELADTLRNEVRRRARKIPVNAANLVERGKHIEWLLERAREESWVYDEALAQADLYLQCSGGDAEGMQWKLRVLRAKGDLAGEYALLAGLGGNLKDSAFQFEGLGSLKSRLGLQADAERDLRQAVAKAPLDARAQAGLAAFLLERGRAREAVPAAQQAAYDLGSLTGVSERARVITTIVAASLAIGDQAAATQAIADAPPGVQGYLKACIDYAAGDVKAALDGFQQASTSDEPAAAALGRAACLLRLEQWQDALSAFEGVAEQAPLLRHRALTGIALLNLRLGQFAAALTAIERALEANPQDAYAFYLRGRALRLQGQLQPARDAIAAALRLRDDFVFAVAEMAAIQAGLAADSRGDDQAAAALAALRYGDRAVALAQAPQAELRELQGLYHFAAADLRGAESAFAAARDLAAGEEAKLWPRACLAVVDYAQGRIEDALDKLRHLLELPREHAMRKWAEATQQLIDDHLQKEQLNDPFSRDELGTVWNVAMDGTLTGVLTDGALVLRGRFTRGEVAVDRPGSVPRAGRFLAVRVRMLLGKAHQRGADQFAGLRLETARNNGGQPDFVAQFGVRDGKPFLRVAEGKEEPQSPEVKVAGFDVAAEQTLELAVVPRGDQARQFSLVARWNGEVVQTVELKNLNSNTGVELRTQLVASGQKQSECDVRFDDYHLERRKEAR